MTPLSEKITKTVERSSQWLMKVRNKDRGWGPHGTPPSYFTETVEVLYGLLRAGVDPRSRIIRESVELIEKDIVTKGPLWQDSPETAKKHLWALMMFAELKGKGRSKPIQMLLKGLDEFRLKDGSWCHMLKEEGDVHDTSLAFITLPKLRVKQDSKQSKWLISTQNTDGGWGFRKNKESNPVATALAIEALAESNSADRKFIDRGVFWLKKVQGDNGRWPIYYESRMGWGYDVLIHFSTPCVILALAKAGEPVNSKSLGKGIDFLLSLESDEGGIRPVKEFPFCRKINPVTWATANAMVALSRVLENL